MFFKGGIVGHIVVSHPDLTVAGPGCNASPDSPEQDRRTVVRSALRNAQAAGEWYWGDGYAYASIYTCVSAIVSMYWEQVIENNGRQMD